MILKFIHDALLQTAHAHGGKPALVDGETRLNYGELGDRVRRLASCGLPVEEVALRVVNDGGEPVAPGEVGEITARGPNIMLGYWKRPQETAEALAGGWLHTGELATVDGEGFVTIVDRAKHLIISGGENVYSSEVENALYKHPAVAEAAVIGVPDPRWGEAVVVPRPDLPVTEAELISHCKRLIAPFKCPQAVAFSDSLPRNAAAKILEAQLREPYWTAEERAVH